MSRRPDNARGRGGRPYFKKRNWNSSRSNASSSSFNNSVNSSRNDSTNSLSCILAPKIITLLPSVPCPYVGWDSYFIEEYSKHSKAAQKVSFFSKYLMKKMNNEQRESVWSTFSFKVKLTELWSDAELKESYPEISTEVISSPFNVLSALGLAMHQLTELWSDAELKESYPEISTEVISSPFNVLSALGLAMHQILVEMTDEALGSESSLGPQSADESSRGTAPLIKVPYIMPRLCDDRNGETTSIRNLKANLYGTLVTIEGTVVRVSNTKQQCKQLAFSCLGCLTVFAVVQPDGKYCSATKCPTNGCVSRQFTVQRSHYLTQTFDFQIIRIQQTSDTTQETDSNCDHGRVPRSVECHLVRDLVDSCVPGDHVSVTGVVKVEQYGESSSKQGDACMFTVCVHATDIDTCKAETNSPDAFTIADYYNIKEIHDRDEVFSCLVHSLCPAIFGQDMIKAGLLLCLFGGSGNTSDEQSAKTGVREESHMLIVGDPGMGKSQMLQSCVDVAPRGVFVCGNASTSSGLTVSVAREAGTGDYSLEAGALVMAHRGICCIDEFDKMNQMQHQALLEGMEQQCISIAKGGFVCRLPSQTSVLAAANPVQGHYNKAKTVSENIRIGGPLLSRFDLVFILVDNPNQELDSLLSKHVMSLHSSESRISSSNAPENPLNSSVLNRLSTLRERLASYYGHERELVSHSDLKKYISYARRYVHPRLSGEAATILQTFYLELRSNYQLNGEKSPPITTRHLEALVRLTQSRAKCELREEATAEDAQDVVELMQHSMIDTYSDQLGCLQMERSHSSTSTNRGQVKKLLQALQRQAEVMGKSVFSLQDLKKLGNQCGVSSVVEAIDSLNLQGFLLSKSNKTYQLTTAP